ncbi:ParB/RepB/Spo0J family partition protein [Neolewinella persica]|uniref:ParB/RepB/Spo0J family partition protein n=1 Tax=Neolewinella persica TaxID=70998 RepID=UPI00035F00BB|nr:ParB/RepB/Spo0J family partition protein [Neolewinella persica]
MAKPRPVPRKAPKGAVKSGLDALFQGKRLDKAIEESPAETIAALSKDFLRLSISKIHANPDQPRKEFEEAPLQELAESIRIHGIIQPMTVRHMGDGTYQIISGERRFRASQLAGLKEVPAFIRTADDQTLLEMALIENIQRQDLNPMEVAYSYFRLSQDFSLTQHEVADRVGKQRTTVTNYLSILRTSPQVQQAIRDKKISIGAAKAVAGIKDISLQEMFLAEILVNPDWSVRAIERKAADYKAKRTAAKKSSAAKGTSDDLKTVKKAFEDFFETKKVTVKLDGKAKESGTITIQFTSKDELEHFYKTVEL